MTGINKTQDMHDRFYIKSFCTIRQHTLALNNDVLYKGDEPGFSGFIKAAYRSLGVNYPKFFKMDLLSKLAFLAAEALLSKEEPNENTAVVFSNRASSLDTDRVHQQSIQDKEDHYPSPAVFVYTLPNICVGEICIKHKLYAENSFFIFDRFNPGHLYTYANSLLATDKAKNVLCGWVELDGEDHEAFLYLAGPKGDLTHNEENIRTLYEK